MQKKTGLRLNASLTKSRIMTKLVIFDLDGTLLNTVEDLGNATNFALKECLSLIHI